MLLKGGEVWDADFDQRPDSRQNGVRPAVVVQTDHLNDKAPYPITILVPISGGGSEKIPSHALIRPTDDNGLSKESFAKCEQIQALPKSHLIRKRGSLSPEDLAKVNTKLKNALDLNDAYIA
ncbi:hypothetical protein BH11ARM2_BH11ARM2_25960 [soil metagenome]